MAGGGISLRPADGPPEAAAPPVAQSAGRTAGGPVFCGPPSQLLLCSPANTADTSVGK